MREKENSDDSNGEPYQEEYLDNLIDDANSGSENEEPNDNFIPVSKIKRDVEQNEYPFDSILIKEESGDMFDDYGIKNEAKFQMYTVDQEQNYHYECSICYKSFKTKEAEKYHNKGPCKSGTLMKVSNLDDEDSLDDTSISYNTLKSYSEANSGRIELKKSRKVLDYQNQTSYIKRAQKLARNLKEDEDEWNIEVQDASYQEEVDSTASYFSLKQEDSEPISLAKTFKNKNTKQKRNFKQLDGSNKKMYYCDLCSYSSEKRSSVQIHLKLKKHVNLTCDRCPYTSGTKDNYDRHVKYVHTDYRPAQCSKCPYAGKNKYDLNTHYKRHEMTYHYKCNVCDKTFRSIKSVRYHKSKVCTEAYFYKIDNENEEVQPLRKTLPKFMGANYKEEEEVEEKEPQQPAKIVTFNSLRVNNKSQNGAKTRIRVKHESSQENFFDANFLDGIVIEKVN